MSMTITGYRISIFLQTNSEDAFMCKETESQKIKKLCVIFGSKRTQFFLTFPVQYKYKDKLLDMWEKNAYPTTNWVS